MHIYQVPTEYTITPADPSQSDSYRSTALNCATVAEMWEVRMALKSERAKGMAVGLCLGFAMFFLMWAAAL